MDTAQEIRAEARAFLTSLQSNPDEQIRRSQQTCEKFLNLFLDKEALTVALYKSHLGELDLGPLETGFSARGYRLCYPKVIGQTEMGFFEADPRASKDWTGGRFGILEPKAGAKEILTSDIDIILTPGLAFDRHMGRLGRGMGFYDRALRQTTKALRVALVYDELLYDEIPLQSWDERVHWIVTANDMARSDRALEWIRQ